MTAQDIRRMLDLLASIDARMAHVETKLRSIEGMLVALIAEDFESPTPDDLRKLREKAQRRYERERNDP